MRANVGNLDRLLRVIIAAAGVAAALLIGAGSIGGILLLVVAGVMLVTAAVGFCPLYGVLGINTCPRRAAPR